MAGLSGVTRVPATLAQQVNALPKVEMAIEPLTLVVVVGDADRDAIAVRSGDFRG